MLLDRGRHCNRPTLPTWPTNSSFAETSPSNRVQYSIDCLPSCCPPLCTRIYMCICMNVLGQRRSTIQRNRVEGNETEGTRYAQEAAKITCSDSKNIMLPKTGAPSSQNFRSFSYKRSSRISYSRHSRHPLALDKNR